MYNLAGTRLYVDPDLLSEVQDKVKVMIYAEDHCKHF